MPRTYAEILAAVTELLPEVERLRGETARRRRLPDELAAALRAAGAFSMPMPASWGGPELTPRQQTEIVEVLATADPSVSWCVMIGSDAGYYSAFLDDAAGRELFPDVDDVVAGWLIPAGRADVVDGGYRVSGRWSFGSCSPCADVLAGGCLVYEGDELRMADNGLPDMRIALAPAERWDLDLDSWDTIGLAGTGSCDYAVDDLFVPERHTFSLAEPPRRAGALYQFPGMFFTNMAGVGLGLARRAIDEAARVAGEKLSGFTLLRDEPRARNAFARAEMALGASRAYTYSTLDALWDHLQEHDELMPDLRRDVALSRVHAFRTAREVAELMVDLIGTEAIRTRSPLGGLLADAVVMNQHIVAQDRMLDIVGGLLVGDPPPLPFV